MPPIELLRQDSEKWLIATDGEEPLKDATAKKNLAVSRDWSGGRILDLMMQHGSTCFSGTASSLEDVVDEQVRRQANMDLKFMVGFAMAVSGRVQSLAARELRTPVYGAYSSVEAHKIAHQCPASGGYHVNSELVLVEILDDNNETCWPGETGRVVVTPFLSAAQPLIRYEQGDMATWGATCACGRAHPVIATIEGRMRHRFKFANGRWFYPSISFELYRDILMAKRWQVAQTGALEIEVRFVSDAPDEAIDFAALTAIYQTKYHPNISVSYRRLAEMPRTAAGKFLDYVNEISIQPP